MLQKLIEYFNTIKKTQVEMKVALNEIKKSLQGTNSAGEELKNKINDLEHKKGKSIQSEQQEEKRIKKKNEERLRNLWDNFKRSNIWIIGLPEEEEEE